VFNPSRLTLARQRRGLTKTKLAAEAQLTVRSVSAYEAGDMVPSDATIAELVRVLQFPIDFFMASSLDTPSSESASFRALSSMTAGQRDSALGAGALAIELSEWINARFNLPEPALPDLRGHTPEAAAEAIRGAWGLGERPVKNVVHLLEARGVRVFSLVEDCMEVDAFSLWRGSTPYVFLNTMKSAERSRFDSSHELGHLVLHRHGAPQGREAEKEADAFASAFLMPRGSVLATAPRLPSLDTLVKLKRNWNVSVAALAHRMHAVDLMSEWHYRTLCIEIAQRGYKRSEPNGIPRETSQLLQKVFQALRDEGMTKAAIAKQLHIDSTELESLVFGLVMTPMQGGRTGPGPGNDGRRGRGQLQVV
jgi:Zn-dependent peptidase ImmA (M78 family)/transcriptional regulator with XRE-family HTH domain